MNTIIRLCLVLGALCAFVGCQSTTGQKPQVVQAIQDPNNIGKFIQGATAVAVNRVLANNPSYAGEIAAAGNTLLAIAQGNPNTVSADDIGSALAKTSLPDKTKAEVVADFTTGLGLFQSSFQVQFPSLKPNYAIYLIAISNGINIALGKPTVPLPVIPWPPAGATPAPTPNPAT